jgi:hypothetical protein
MLAAAAPAGTVLTQSGGAVGVALLSALLTQRTAFHCQALLPLANTTAAHVNIALPEASRTAGSTSLLLGFRDCFLVTGNAGLMPVPVGLLLGDRANFTDRLKRALTLFG